MDHTEKLKLSIMRLLNLKSLRLFGGLIYNFNIHNINFQQVVDQIKSKYHGKPSEEIEKTIQLAKDTCTAHVTIIDEKPTLMIYDYFLGTHTVEELTFVLQHEILHVLSGHLHRGRNFTDQKIFDLACDHVINSSLVNDIQDKKMANVSIPKNTFYIKKWQRLNMTVEEVYQKLLENSTPKKQITIQISNQQNNNPNSQNNIDSGGSGGDDGNHEPQNDDQNESSNNEQNGEQKESSNNNQPNQEQKNNDSEESYDGPEFELSISELDFKGQIIKTKNDLINSQNTSAQEEYNISELIKSELRTTMNEFGQSGKGNNAGSVYKLLSQIIEIEIPWEIILEKALLNKLATSPDERTWSNPNKRLKPHGFIFPGNHESYKTSTAVIGIDMSGSISDTDIKKFANIVLESIEHFDNIWIIKHDTIIHEQVKEETDDISAVNFVFQTKGRGGTSHKYVFNEIEKEFQQSNSDNIGIVILLTDFDSDIENIWNKYEWTKHVPVSICLTRSKYVPHEIDRYPILIK